MVNIPFLMTKIIKGDLNMTETSNEKSLDLRIRKTHKLLCDSLISLMREKSFEEIKISEICERAMVHRTTFYKHFEDKYDLLKFWLNSVVNELQSKITPTDTPREHVKSLCTLILKHIKEDKSVFLVGFRNMHQRIGLIYLQQTLSEHIAKIMDESIKNGFEFIMPPKIICEFISSGLVSIGIWWFENNMEISIDKMIEYGTILINNDLATYTK